MQFKAVAIRQPYARFLCDGRKDIEVRSWKTDYRGPVLICAQHLPLLTFDSMEDEVDFTDNFNTGCVLGIADLVDVRPLQKRDTKRTGEHVLDEMLGVEDEVDYYKGVKGYSLVFKNPRMVDNQAPADIKRGLYDIEIPDEVFSSLFHFNENGEAVSVDINGNEIPGDEK